MFSDLSDIPAPPLLDDILTSQSLDDDFESFSASQALKNSPIKGHGILKSRSGLSQPRPRVRFVPPMQRPAHQPSHSQTLSQNFPQDENLFPDTFGSQPLGTPGQDGRSRSLLDDRQRARHSAGDSYPTSIYLPGESTPGGTRRGSKCVRSIEEIPEQYRSIFPFPYFNFVQSEVLDDTLYTDKPLVISAPTGSGKTVIFELAILRLLISQGGYDNRTKIVYMAPIKVLCSQRCEEWKEKFEPLGLKCQELTGDTDIDDFYQLQAVNIIFTTPEKWDSMTRRWRDNRSLVQLVKLFLVDEVHSLNEETRGATVEAVISRMKTVQAAQPHHDTNATPTRDGAPCSLRFLAVSATIPNIKDIAGWLGSGEQSAVYHKFDDSHRPVKLRKVVLGYPCSENFSEFKFDLSLNYKLSGVIQTYSDNKPSLVFCATRKGVEQAAAILVKEARFIMNAACRQRLQMYNNRIRDAKLRDLVMNGVGYHHAGLDLQDRKAIEEMFLQGDLPVLMATSTLAMGVNLPAHLVVVKSTQHYAMGSYTEYSETQILQMIGRAGRPQFDTSATAVIMTKTKTKGKYDNLLNGTEDIESSLHNHLIEHLNAEIVLQTITKMEIALEWLKSTFLYIRIQQNPAHYGLPKRLTQGQLEKRLQDMCTKDLASLASINLIEMDKESSVLKPLETGRLMARYCVAFETMKQFTKLQGDESVSDLILLLSKCKEFSDVQLRVNERKVLNKMNKDKNHVTIRYPMTGKIKTSDMKVNCLIQATLGSIPIQEFALNQDCYKIFRAGQRLTRCLTEYLMTKTDHRSLLNAVVTAKCVAAKLWENSRYVSRQLDKIGPTMSTALVNAGLVSFHKLQAKNPREIELIVNRHPPFGNQVIEAVTHLPKYDVSIEQMAKYSPMRAEISVTVSLLNQAKLLEKRTAKPNHTCLLLLGDADNKVVYKQRVSDNQLLQSGIWMRKVEVQRALKGEDLSVNLISQDYVGLDVQSTYTPFYSGPKHLRAVTEPPPHTQGPRAPMVKRPVKRPLPASPGSARQALTTPSSDLESPESIYWRSSDGEDLGRKPCSHRCLNKDTCGHTCCKLGIPLAATPRPKAPPTKRAATEDGVCSRGTGDVGSVSATPGKSRAPRGIAGFLDQLHQRSQAISATPTIKRLKFGESTPTALPSLDKFTYAPNRSLLPAMNRAAAAASASTPSPTGEPSPAAPPPASRTPPKATGWDQLDFYLRQRELHVEAVERRQGSDEELPKINLGYDAEREDVPCFDLECDDVICIDDATTDQFHPPPDHAEKAKNLQHSNSYRSSSCHLSMYPWAGSPLEDAELPHDQFVPPLNVPAGRQLVMRGRENRNESLSSSCATLTQPMMEYVHTERYDQHVPPRGFPTRSGLPGVCPGFVSAASPRDANVAGLPPMSRYGVRDDQFVPVPTGTRAHRPFSGKEDGSSVPWDDLPIAGPVSSSDDWHHVEAQLSSTWTRPFGRPSLGAQNSRSGAKSVHQQEEPCRPLFQPFRGTTARSVGSLPGTPLAMAKNNPASKNASPDEQTLARCLDAVEQEHLLKKQGTISQPVRRPPDSSFFVTCSTTAEDDSKDYFDSIFKDLF